MKPYTAAFFLIFCLLFHDSPLYTQTESRVDSLLNELKFAKADTTKVDLYLDLHKSFVSRDTTEALKYLDKAIALSQQIHDNPRLARAYLRLCNFRWKKGQFKKAKNVLLETEALLSNLSDSKTEATFYMEHGIVDYLSESYESAVDHFIQAMSRYEAIGDMAGYAKCYSNIGMTYWKLEAYDEALDYYQRSLEINKDSADYLFKSRVLGNMGLIYKAKKDFKRALENYQESLDINRRNNQKLDAAINLQNIGALYAELKNYKKALAYYEESNQLSKSIDNTIGVLYTNHGIGKMKSKLGDYKNATNKLQEALDQAVEKGMKEETKNIYSSFAELYEATGNPSRALKYWKEYEILKDSLAKEEHLEKVKALELQYQASEKEKEIILLTKEAEIQQTRATRQKTLRNTLIVGILLIAAIAGLIFYGMRQKLKAQKTIATKNEEIKNTKFQQQLGELENKALRSQMNPHFIFNCMNSINRRILNNEGEDASLLLTKFAKLIRLMLENSESDSVSLQNELDMLRSYIQLEALTNQNKISYEVSVDPNIDADSIQIPSMVLQPFIENAIWHGIMNKGGKKGNIRISIVEEGNSLKCTIEDNGIGREKALQLKNKAAIKTKSMGLKIIQKRLELLGKNNFTEMICFTDLKDDSGQPSGTRVDVLIPIS
ncbi:MAG: tetratricopeptide repeat protein [Flavobacteriaceae bacterium]